MCYNTSSNEEWDKVLLFLLIGGYMSIESKVKDAISKPINDLGIEIKEIKLEKKGNQRSR